VRPALVTSRTPNSAAPVRPQSERAAPVIAMAGGRSGLLVLVLATLLGQSAGLRLGDQPALARSTARERAAREAGVCGKGELPLDMARRGGAGGQTDCDDLIPRYDMAAWIEQHGKFVPDHPAVFVNTGTHEAEVFPSMEVFLARHGNERVVALPEYAQSGSHLKDPNAAGRINASFRELADIWNDTFVYFSDFKCLEGSLCWNSSQQFGAPAIFATRQFQSKNFLVGGPDSGLPFHKHGMTWQGLSMGRKAWYVLPPGSMSEEMHDETGPYIFPVRAYHGSMVAKPLGQRPLYCVQHPGEVVYVPNAWWHATMNLDRFQVAYGEKPNTKHQENGRSPALARMLGVFPQRAFDSAGYTSAMAAGEDSNVDPMPYSLVPRRTHLMHECGRRLDDAAVGLGEPMRRMRALAGSRTMRCGLAETAAFAHCTTARLCQRVSDFLVAGHGLENCSLDVAAGHRLKVQASQMMEEAAKLSPELYQREHSICGTIRS